MIKIFLVDDHPIFREGLKRIFEKANDIEVVAEAGSSEEFMSKAAMYDFDTVLLDIAMPGRGGLDLLGQIKAMNPGIKTLVLSMYAEDHYAVPAFKAGASGYLTKDKASGELVDAVRKVAGGGKYVSATLAERFAMLLEKGGDGSPPHELLSPRELQVMSLIASGKTNREIARRLSLSKTTISTYRARILEKMDLKNNAEITRYAVKHNLDLNE